MKKIISLAVLSLFLLSLFSASVFAVEKGIHITSMSSNIDVSSGDTTIIYLELTNDMAVQQNINIECGIFADHIARDWGLLALTYAPSPIDSCGGEIFVTARSITMTPNEKNELEIPVLAPYPTSKLSDGTSNWDSSHSLVCGLYTECGAGYHTSNGVYGGGENGAWDIWNINVRDIVVVPNTCGNDIIDKDENCGTCSQDVTCAFGETCTYKPKTLFASETYVCEPGKTEFCVTHSDCDDGNIETLDNCVGTFDRKCAYSCKDTNIQYNAVTGLCVAEKTPFQIFWEDNQLLILGLGAFAFIGTGVFILIILIILITRRNK